MNARGLFLLAALTLPLTAVAQGFAGLGGGDAGFALPDPDHQLTFPEDHGAHAEFRIEWWYVTANLTGENGEDYGVQWTLFRSALKPGGAEADQTWMGHLGISTPERHLAAERFARGAFGTAGVSAEPFEAFIDEWRLNGPTFGEVALFAQGADFAVALELSAQGPWVPQGIKGYSVKSDAGQASHYYSQPFYQAKGKLTLPQGVVRVEGSAWLDREWSSAPLTPTQSGWDWLSLHLETGEKLMAFRLRDDVGADYVTGTWIGANGTPEPLAPGAVRLTPLTVAEVAGRAIPVEWRVEVPGHDADLRVSALRADSFMATSVPYWEGPVAVDGSHGGRGYLEMTGYTAR